jgi:hypothetical protein
MLQHVFQFSQIYKVRFAYTQLREIVKTLTVNKNVIKSVIK